MSNKKNIKYILFYGVFLLIFMSLSFTLYGIPKDLWMYIAVYLGLFILLSVGIYFSDFESVKKEDFEPAKRIKHIFSNKLGWSIVALLTLFADMIFFAIAYNFSFLILFGIFAILFLIIFYLAYLIYKFFIKKEPVVPLLWTGDDLFEQKPSQYFYITAIIIMFIVTLVFTRLAIMNLFFD